MSHMFSSYYEFDIGEGYYSRVDKMTTARLNREHKHSDVEFGLDDYTHNWECIAESTERRRGSDKLYLVNDEYYIWCSRTGMEKSGNSIHFSKNTPEELRFCVWSALFEKILERKFGSIKEGIDKKKVMEETGGISPRAFILADKLTQDELNEYFDDMADLLVELIQKYHRIQSCGELESLIEWYDKESTRLYRDYTNFKPTILSEVLTEIEGFNGWVVPDKVDGAKRLSVIINRNHTPELKNGVIEEYAIEINEMTDNEVKLVYDNVSEKVLKEKKYETKDELRNILQDWFKLSPSNMDPQ